MNESERAKTIENTLYHTSEYLWKTRVKGRLLSGIAGLGTLINAVGFPTAILASGALSAKADNLKIENRVQAGIGGGLTYLQHINGAQEGLDGNDHLLANSPPNPNQQVVKIYTLRDDTEVDIDARPLGSNTRFDGYGKVVDQTNPDGVIVSSLNRTRLIEVDGTLDPNQVHTLRIDVPNQNFLLYTNINEVLANGGFIDLPAIPGYTNGFNYMSFQKRNIEKVQQKQVLEDNQLAVDLTTSNQELSGVEFQLLQNATNGNVAINGDTANYIGNANFNGSDSFSVAVKNPLNGLPLATNFYNINVSSVNDSPVSYSTNYTTGKNQTLTGLLNATDVDGDNLAYSIVANPLHGNFTLNNTNGTFIYTPVSNYVGADSFSFTASDGSLTSSVANVSINVTNVNRAPTISGAGFNTLEDTLLSGSVSVDDPDDEPVSLSAVALPQYGLLNINGTNFTYAPLQDFNGTDSFRLRASDGQLFSEADYSVNVQAVNDAPVANDLVVNVREDEQLTFSLPVSDIDSINLNALLVSPATKGNVSFNGTNATYTPLADLNGIDEFDYKVSDGELDSVVKRVRVNLEAVNDAPVAQDLAIRMPINSSTNFNLNVYDKDGNPLSVGVAMAPQYGSVNGSGTNWVYNSGANTGNDRIIFNVSDGIANAVANVDFSIFDTNNAPIAVSKTIEPIEEETSASVELEANDADGDPISFAIFASPAHGSLSQIVSNRVTYTPELNFNGSDSFSYVASDGRAVSQPAVVNIPVNAVNDIRPYMFVNLGSSYAGAAASQVVSGDVNKDLKQDLLVLNKGTEENNGFSVLHGQGDGNFFYAANYSLSNEVKAIEIGDINRDGGLDAIVANGGNLSLFYGGGNGSFGFGNNFPVGNAVAVGVYDFNKDARLDVAAALPDENKVGILFNNGAGFGNIAKYPVEAGPVALIGGDFDRNGKLDLAVANKDANSVSVLYGNGIIFSNAISYAVGMHPSALATNDFNRDGKLDVAVAHENGVSVLLKNPIGLGFGTPINYADGIIAHSIVSADFDKDGKPDIAFSDRNDNSVSVLKGNGDGTLSEFYGDSATYYPINLGPNSLTLVDADKNGNMDIASADFGGESVSILLNAHTPKAYSQNIVLREDTPTPITLTGFGGPLDFSITIPPLKGSLSGASPNYIYEPRTNEYGKDSFSFVASDGASTSLAAKANLNILPVNDQPRFITLFNSVSVLEDSGAFKQYGFVTSIDKGAANEYAQSIKYLVSTDNTNLFSRLPSVLGGTLYFTPKKNMYGSAIAQIRAIDSGGVSNGGINTSEAKDLSIVVQNVNDTPILTAIPGKTSVPGRTILEDSLGTNYSFGVYDLESLPQDLVLSVNSTNTALLPLENINVLSDGTNRAVSVVPVADMFGKTLLTFNLSDGTNSVSKSSLLSVTSVNDMPSYDFRVGEVVVPVNAGLVTTNVIENASTGPANESLQTKTFKVTRNTAPLMFLTQPTINPLGYLTFKAKTGVSGVSDLEAILTDNGGVSYGGRNTSIPKQIRIRVGN